ncbi:CPBP family intramembrane glutamic endopeptidase [Pseudaestuariivita atlantica]|uniref:CAAX prenyl protease 2/Lysostaphin resistance protein A-like domain-containing protein n=1 Tax=Pseudaestuariivita atlantica TaxID=1317121 RepID=A0A0L1JSH4_9RHOB|nr:type II CAAX endopeptidase family protein [Pseudaestuariivita atlantica]KNG94686.1 hypothetical protein ATO11_04635 [Pseudaestuariivita atlantica]
MDYRLHHLLTDPARPTAQLWRLVAGAALIVLMYVVLGMVMMSALSQVVGELGYAVLTDEMNTGATPRGMLAQLFGIGLLTIPVLLVTMSLHQRAPLGLFGPLPLATAHFVRVTIAAFAASLLIWVLPPSEYLVDPVRAMAMRPWLALLPLSLAAVLVQVMAEELVFRGYLQQQLAARFDHWVIWMGVPSALFAMLHYAPEFGPNAWLVVAWAFAFGCAAADLTARSGTLGAAIGLHFANNTIALLIVALRGNFDALALWHLPVALSDAAAMRPMILIDFVVLICLWIAARVALRR